MKRHCRLRQILCSMVCLTIAVFVISESSRAVTSLASLTSGQKPRKSVEQAFSFQPQVRFSKLKSGEIERRLNEEFEESDDWPKRLSFEIQSVAVKPIVYIELNLNFPETRTSGNLMSFPIRLGVRPDLNFPRDNEAFRLMPDEKVSISIARQYDKLAEFVERRTPMSTINKIQLEVGFIIFEDGTAWAGEFLRPDPSKPGRYVPAR